MTEKKNSFGGNLIAIMLAVLLLASCELIPRRNVEETLKIQVNPTATQTPVIGVNAGEVLEKLPKGIKIVFWHPWSGEMANLVNELTMEFNQENEWGITVLAEAYADDLVLAQQVAGALEDGGLLPALIAAPEYLFSLIEAEGAEFRDLNKYLTSQPWGISQADLDRFFPIFLKTGERGDLRIGFPAYRTGNFLFFNQTWANELGFSQVPQDPKSFSDVACAAAMANQFGSAQENIGTGGWIYSLDANSFYSWLKSFGGGAELDPENNVRLANAPNIDSSLFLYEMFLPQNNCAWRGRQSVPYEYFAKRQALAYSGIMEEIPIQDQVSELLNSEDAWTVIPYPSDSGKPVVFVSGESYGILSTDETQSLAAWLFIKWMTQPNIQSRIVEATFSLPLSAATLDRLGEFRMNHDAWSDSLTYLPLMEPFPSFNDWPVMQDIFSDISWQLTQFTTTSSDIPLIWENAEALLQELH